MDNNSFINYCKKLKLKALYHNFSVLFLFSFSKKVPQEIFTIVKMMFIIVKIELNSFSTIVNIIFTIVNFSWGTF